VNVGLAQEACLTSLANVTAFSPLPVLPLHPLFVPYGMNAQVSSPDGTAVDIQMLRDTGALQSLVLKPALPSNAYQLTGEVRLLKGISAETVEVPLVELRLKSDFFDETI
jgi:hypothetical protein